MQNAGAIVARGLMEEAKFAIVGIDQDQQLAVGRNDFVLVNAWLTIKRP